MEIQGGDKLNINVYDSCRKELQELIELADLQKRNTHVISVFDNPYQLSAMSGMIFPVEIEDVEAGFLCSAGKYTGYMDYLAFEKDLINGLYCDSNMKYLVYNTSQQGTSIDRRSYIPMLCERYHLFNLTCSAYKLGLLMNKSHHFLLLRSFGHIPMTDIYSSKGLCFKNVTSDYVILKPSLECAALGVKKLKNNSSTVEYELSAMRAIYKQDIIMQEYIPGYEVSVPVIKKGDNYIALPPVWVKFKEDILTYSSVDNFEYSFAVLPTVDFPYNEIISPLCRHATQIMSYIKADGLTRVDYRIKNATDFFVFDIAALPVIADTGSCMQSFKYLFQEKESIFKCIIGSALY